ncbi:hypothetical protein ACQKLP_07910 [Chitinophaga sp. NPDC101104]|uniref:hypothetical protein n=1 Tax=Chitinophaga sp. NPDC101104 TaxID=3390561 RepID=UPI003D02D0D8
MLPGILYTAEPGLVIGFHGCDQEVRDSVLAGDEMLRKSVNAYDWLGNGYYFWQNNFERALEFARYPPGKQPCERPAVLGAILNLGNCLDLTDKKCLISLEESFHELRLSTRITGKVLPGNKPAADSGELLLRYLDCSVFEYLHVVTEREKGLPYDSVRGIFVEGKPVFDGAGIYDKTHVQICIRNPNCILGFFLPREAASWP